MENTNKLKTEILSIAQYLEVAALTCRFFFAIRSKILSNRAIQPGDESRK